MNKIVIALVLLAQAVLAHANLNENEIVLPKEYKAKGSFSGELAGDDSFHIIVGQNKSKKDFELFLYAFISNEIKYLNKASYEKQPAVLSFHSTAETLTLVISYENNRKDYYNVLDVNLNDGTINKSADLMNQDALATFRGNDETVLLNGSKKLLTATRIENSGSIVKTEAKGYSRAIYDRYFDSYLNEVNQNEYVKNGPINSIKGYYRNNELIFTREHMELLDRKQKHATEVLRFDLQTGGVQENTFEGVRLNKIAERESYVLGNMLIQFSGNKKEGALSFHNLTTKARAKTISLLTFDLDKTTRGKDFTTMEEFLKELGRKKHESTLTLNRTKSSNYVVRLDYVLNTYNYNYNWWWHHHMFMMQQHQMMMQNSMPSGFGPDAMSSYEHYLDYEDTKDHSIRFVVDGEGKLVAEDVGNTVFKAIDKRKYVQELNDNKSLKHISSCFIEGKFRYIGYVKKAKSFQIFNKQLN